MEKNVQFLISLAATLYSIGFGVVAKKVWDVPKLVEDKLNSFSKKIDKNHEALKENVDLAHKRLAVHDRISSKMIDHEFDSKAIVESGNFPEIRTSES